MNKRITSLALVFVMVLSMLATAVPALAAPIESTQLKVVPDITTASPGDTINYTVVLGPVSDMGSMQMQLEIPEGLTYVPNSGKLVDGLKETLGFDAADFTEVSLMVNGFASAADYESDTDTELAKFQCTVNDGYTGTVEVGLYNLEFGSCQTFENHTDRFSVVKTPVTVTAAPITKPATDITVTPDTLTLTVGDTQTLMADVEPGDTTDTVAWESDKPTIAKVDPTTGEVTAVAPGEAIITATAGSVSATCTVTVEAAPCVHDYGTLIAEKDATCSNTGMLAHYQCSLCHKYFDESKTEKTVAELTIPVDPNAHDFNMSEWGYKESDGHAHVCTRNPAHHDTVVTHSFGDDDTCDICGYERTHVCANHLTKVEEKLADCTNPGNIEHYKCSCGKLYEDATAARELTEDDVNRGALGHDWIDATCTEPKTCDRCGETEGTALGHNWATEWSSNADNHWHACTRCDAKDGEAAHNPGAPATETTPQTCTDCGYVIESATGHVCANHLTKVDRVEADCTTPGNIEHYKCSCGKLYEDATAAVELTEDQVKRDALGHDWIDATCTEPKTCDRCGETEGTALGHNWATEWSSNADNHWHACTRCDAKDGEGAHNPGAPATETTPQICTDCGYEIVPATSGGSSGGGGSSVSTYAITVKDAKNGDVSANRKSAAKGTTITLTVTPDKGYVLDTIKVLDSKDNAIKLTEKDSKFTFIMPGSKVTVEATFKAETPDNPFTDVPEGSYYEDAVIWAVDKGVTGGTSATTFSPDGICTRAQAVTFLWRAAGSPAPKSSAMPFTDVKAGSYYYDAVLWAVEQGITAGTSATTFAPDLNCSRAQIVTFLYRAAGSPTVSGSPAFTDVAADAYYAKAVKWAQANGITTGIGGGLFGSDGSCTRAQIVTFIYRYMEK